MIKLKRRSAEERAYKATIVVVGLMRDFLGELSPLHRNGETLDDSLTDVLDLVYYDLSQYETAAQTSEALWKAAKIVKREVRSRRAKAWLDLCVDMTCKSLSSAERGDEAIAFSTANECIGTCMEALSVLEVFNEHAVEALFK